MAPTKQCPRIEVRRATFDEVASMFAELDVDLARRYGGGEPVHVSRVQFDPPGGALLVATDEDRRDVLLGCVGVRELPVRDADADVPPSGGVAELKRMYVRPVARRIGLARTLLGAAESTAASLGYRHLWLETGLRQPEAVELYRSAGYTPVARFGQFAHESESVYLGRVLGD